MKLSRVIIYLLLYVGAAVCLVPFYWLIRSSLMDMNQIFQYPLVWIPSPFRFENYAEALTVLPFGRYFLNTGIIVVSCVAGILISCSLSAYGLSRINWPGRELVFAIIMTSLMLPYFATLIPNFIMWKNLNLVNTYVPLILPSWFGVGTMSIIGGGMFNIFLLRQFFRSLPKELDEAAFMDGAGHFKIYATIIVPLSKPALISTGLFTFLNTWNDFVGPLIYLNGEEKYTLQLGLRTFIGNYAAQWHLLMAAATVVLVPVIILFFIGQRYFVEGIATSGIKG
ncbi:carbohydrate ABC transporter permease [Paenibacillus agricola]|uniref:Carbohydrate ABC transporter permease n=1 Tax=Paenibacillus agricola TaxID=2716264 RepID=A0ABX0JBB9_9BACL|nr:carbohydrate ABC transporter permease [Paenibacillus agricola]NHN32172.1 carbohydrate ABC transporter permease [Paenibacillus agricola]